MPHAIGERPFRAKSFPGMVILNTIFFISDSGIVHVKRINYWKKHKLQE